MALLDMLTTKVRTLETWSPEVPLSRIDMNALIADMRRSGVAAVDAYLNECLDTDPILQYRLRSTRQDRQRIVHDRKAAVCRTLGANLGDHHPYQYDMAQND